MMKHDVVVALDLEGTLISNAMSQFPRHGLYRFLELCDLYLPRVVLYTAVRRERALEIVNMLVQEKEVPSWFQEIEYIEWSGDHKDLGFIPEHHSEHVILVDDNKDYVAPDQHDRWIRIEEFAHPYSEDDELQRVWEEINTRLELDAIW